MAAKIEFGIIVRRRRETQVMNMWLNSAGSVVMIISNWWLPWLWDNRLTDLNVLGLKWKYETLANRVY